MHIVKNILITLAIVLASLFLASCCTVLVLESGMLGTCFEGSCGYAGLFLLIPGFWLLFTIAGIGSWLLLRGRRRQRREHGMR